MILEPLYKKSSKGKIEVWQISVLGNVITTTYGEYNGKQQATSDTIKSGKNIGRSNETTKEEQAIAEAKAKHDKKLKSGYVTTWEDAKDGVLSDLITGGIEPMLAFSFEKQGDKITYPCYTQPKLDGIRCIAIKNGDDVTLWTRTRKPINSCPHIIEAIKELDVEEIILDGELYNHTLKHDFEKIVSAVRKDEPSELSKLIQYHVYDVVENCDYIGRCGKLERTLGNYVSEVLQEVPTFLIGSESDIADFTKGFIRDGYEGAMLRNALGTYENKRSTNLIKVKEFDSDEFFIFGMVEGRGKLSGHAGTFQCATDDGATFEAKLKGSMSRLKELFEGPQEDWLGKKLTVQYQGKTSKGIPRFPVGVEIRDYE